MADQGSGSIRINAEPAAVMAVIADVASYPEWSTGITSVTVDELGDDGRPARATFTLDAGILQDTYTLAYQWSGDEQVTWTLERSRVQRAQEGSYRLEPVAGGTDVTYRLSVDLHIRMPGLFKRRAEQKIIDTALKGLKRRVEGG